MSNIERKVVDGLTIEYGHTLKEYMIKYGDDYDTGDLWDFSKEIFSDDDLKQPNIVYWCIVDDDGEERFYETQEEIEESCKETNEEVLDEGTSNFPYRSEFPLLVFYTYDEFLYNMTNDPDYPQEEQFENERDNGDFYVDWDAFENAKEEFEQKYWDENDICVLDEESQENLESKLDEFNDETSRIADNLYDADNDEDYYALKDIELKIEAGYYEAAYIDIDGEDQFKYMSESLANEQRERFNNFFKELKKEFGLTQLGLAYHASNGETGFNIIKDEALEESKKKLPTEITVLENKLGFDDSLCSKDDTIRDYLENKYHNDVDDFNWKYTDDEDEISHVYIYNIEWDTNESLEESRKLNYRRMIDRKQIEREKARKKEPLVKVGTGFDLAKDTAMTNHMLGSDCCEDLDSLDSILKELKNAINNKDASKEKSLRSALRRLGMDDMTQNALLDEDFDEYDTDSYYNEDDICVYQFPVSFNEVDWKKAKEYGLEYLGKVNDLGYQPGDHLVKGKYKDLKRYCDEYLDYVMHPYYLYKEGDIDLEDILEPANECLKEEKEYLSDKVTQVLDDYGILYGDIVENGDGTVNIVGVDEEEWYEVVEAIKSELGLDVLVPDSDHGEFDDELIVKESLKEEKEVARVEYCVMDKDNNNIECFDNTDDAIAFAKDNEGIRVLEVQYGPKDEHGDEPELSAEEVWSIRESLEGDYLKQKDEQSLKSKVETSLQPRYNCSLHNGVIYCHSRENCEAIASELGISSKWVDLDNNRIFAAKAEDEDTEKQEESLDESNKKYALVVNGEWYSTHDTYEKAQKAQERFLDAIENDEDAQKEYGAFANVEIKEINESLNESMKSEVTKWWKDVESANDELEWGYIIDNGDYSDAEAMHAAMFDMLDDLKEKGASELFNRGKKIYNKYAISKYNESLKEALGRYKIEYWVDEEARDQGFGDIAIETFDDLEDAKEYADKLFSDVASVEVLDTQDKDNVVYGRYPEDESMNESKETNERKRLKYLLDKEECCTLDKGERFELQNLIQKYGYPENESVITNDKNIDAIKDEVNPSDVIPQEEQDALAKDEVLEEGGPGSGDHRSASQRYNDRLNATFRRFDEMNNKMAQFLLDHGVESAEVEELKKNTGLHGNALHQKLIELGLDDEFFERKNECKESISAWSIKANPTNEEIEIYVKKNDVWEAFASIENCPTKDMLEEDIRKEYSKVAYQVIKEAYNIDRKYGLYLEVKDKDSGKITKEEKPLITGSKKECDEKKKQLEETSPEDSHGNKNKYIVRELR